MKDSIIRDISLASSGRKKIEWAQKNMPVLKAIETGFIRDRPFEGIKIALSIHLEAKTAYLAQVLARGGAEMAVTGSNPLSTQDDVAAALAADGLKVYAWYGATDEEYFFHLNRTLDIEPDIVIDDGGDLAHLLHGERLELAAKVMGGCEETTTGIMRLRAREDAGDLKFPMLAVNDADCKHLFDNRYGTGQSTWDGIMRTTNLLIAGKYVVIAGYGWCGKGCALRAKGLGANVIVCETNPVKALEALMDGYQVMTMKEAAKWGDIFVTVTGCNRVINAEHFSVMKDGAILANAGHFDVEISLPDLEEMAAEKKAMRKNIDGYRMADGRWLYLLGQGRLVNLAAGDGHPVEIMDLSFALQALSAKHILLDHRNLEPKVYPIPKDIDESVARLKLETMGLEIDQLSEEQEKYLWGY